MLRDDVRFYIEEILAEENQFGFRLPGDIGYKYQQAISALFPGLISGIVAKVPPGMTWEEYSDKHGQPCVVRRIWQHAAEGSSSARTAASIIAVYAEPMTHGAALNTAEMALKSVEELYKTASSELNRQYWRDAMKLLQHIVANVHLAAAHKGVATPDHKMAGVYHNVTAFMRLRGLAGLNALEQAVLIAGGPNALSAAYGADESNPENENPEMKSAESKSEKRKARIEKPESKSGKSKSRHGKAKEEKPEMAHVEMVLSTVETRWHTMALEMPAAMAADNDALQEAVEAVWANEDNPPAGVIVRAFEADTNMEVTGGPEIEEKEIYNAE